MISLIAFFCILAATMAMCGVSAFKTQRDKLLIFVSVKGAAVLSLLIFAITNANLASNMNGSTLFILLALAFQIFSAVISVLPTKNDLFAPLYHSLDMLSAASLAIAGLLLVSLSPFGLPIGFGVGLLTALIVALVKRNFNWKVDITKYGVFIFASSLLAQVVIILLSGLSIANIIFSVGAVVYFAYSILKTFISSENTKFVIIQNILYYLSLIILTASIFLAIY